MSDGEMLDWLEQDTDRLTDVYWHMENEGGTIREAIEFFNREDGE